MTLTAPSLNAVVSSHTRPRREGITTATFHDPPSSNTRKGPSYYSCTMPRASRRVVKACQIPISFGFLMAQIQHKLRVEGRGRHHDLYPEMCEQFSSILYAIAERPREKSLGFFCWKLFEGVSNHFWPGTVRPEDKPATIQKSRRPFVDANQLKVLDTSAISFDELVDLIQSNGSGYSSWPKKTRAERRKEQKMRAGSQIRSPISNPTVLPPLSRPVSSPLLDYLGSPMSLDPQPTPRGHAGGNRDARPSQAPIASPRLSFACRPGWDLNNKTVWIPIAKQERDVSPPAEPAVDIQVVELVEPALLGPASFSRVPEEDTKAFLSKFLGYEWRSSVPTDNTKH
ncbi:hypothetical protein F4802DRAFT_218282 [Xylaria palmicola]|nr:hypothetical protein F4802DRAFT_218282 [Xylaria palmicola]